MKQKETGCCPPFNPEPWQGKEITFKEKLFLKDHVTSVFHMPLNFGVVMKRNMEKIEKAKAKPSEQLVLTDEKSPWGSDVYLAVDKNVPGTEMVKLSGKFLSRVFEGPYRDMKKYIQEMDRYLLEKGKQAKKLYFYYTYCPSCAKAYGKNYIVILAQTT